MSAVAAVMLRHSRVLLALSVFIGVVSAPAAALLRPVAIPAVLLMLVIALVQLDWTAVWQFSRRPGLLGGLLGWQLLGAPIVLAAILGLLGASPVLVTVLVLHAAAPPITASPVLARLVGLDPALTVVLVVLATLCLPVTLVGVVIPVLLESAVAVDLGRLAGYAAAFIGGPFLVAWLIKRLGLAPLAQRHRRGLDLTNLVLLAVFAIGVMDGVQAKLIAEPLVVLGWLAAACAMAVGQSLLAYALWRWQGRPTALGAALCAGNRNLALLLAVTGGMAIPEFALYVAVGQLPIYLMPLVMAPLARRWAPAA